MPGMPDRRGPKNTPDEKQPSDKDRHRYGSDIWFGHSQKAEHHHEDALREKQLPVRVDCQCQLTAQGFEVCHVVDAQLLGNHTPLLSYRSLTTSGHNQRRCAAVEAVERVRPLLKGVSCCIPM